MSQSLSASLDGQTPPQSRVEANFVSFADELHVKVAVASFHDDDDDNTHFFVFFKASALLLHLLSSRIPLLKCTCCRGGAACTSQVRHRGRVLRRVWSSGPLTTPCSQVTHLTHSENIGKGDACIYGPSR